jgi:hypothetical protein
MGNIRTLTANVSYETLTEEVACPLARCEVRPCTAALAPAIFALFGEIAVTSNDERLLVLEVLRAEARVVLADDDIDGTVDAVVASLLVITGGDREADLYVHYLGTSTPAELKDPVLAEELEAVRKWVSSLKGSPYASLAALGPVLEQQVAIADAAEKKLSDATQALKDFREVGARKALVDKINANRQATYGELGDIVHSNPVLGLPRDLAAQSFLHERRPRKARTKELKARLASLQAEVAAVQLKVTAAEAAEQAVIDKKNARKAKLAAKKLADAQKKADAAAAALAALQNPPPTP